MGLSRRAGSVLQDEPEPLSSRLDLRASRGSHFSFQKQTLWYLH